MNATTNEEGKANLDDLKAELEKGFTNITKMVFAFKGKEVKMQVV